jgi:hypothetical protein
MRQANSEVIETNVFGVLQLVLRPDGYDWTFLSAGDTSFTDSGSDSCHDPVSDSASDGTTASLQTFTLGEHAMVAPRNPVVTRRRVRRRSACNRQRLPA